MRNWIIVYSGNSIGAIGTVLLVFSSKQHTFTFIPVGETALNYNQAKVGIGLVQAVDLVFSLITYLK